MAGDETINLDTEYEDFLSTGTAIGRPHLTYDENSIAELFYTSGSTGTPKGVMLSHRTVYMHAMAVAGVFNHDDNGVELHTIPLFHANGWGRAANLHDDGAEAGDGAPVRSRDGLPAHPGRRRDGDVGGADDGRARCCMFHDLATATICPR